MKNRIFIVQLVGDLLFPLFGYFLWNWSLYFILLFIILDLILDLVLVHVKARAIASFQGQKMLPIKYSSLSLLLFIASISLFHVMMTLHQPSIQFVKEIANFWNYKDMGIEQGYVLVPLMILMAIQKYRIEFTMPALNRRLQQEVLWKEHLKNYLWFLAFCGMGIGFILFLKVNDAVLFSLLILILLLRAMATRFFQPAR